MVQLKLLKFLDLMIRNQGEAVPMDAKARADLIDLMAAFWWWCFKWREEKVMTETLYSPKIKPEYLARKAIVCLRQSSEKQVRTLVS